MVRKASDRHRPIGADRAGDRENRLSFDIGQPGLLIMIHHRPQGLDYDFLRRGYVISSAAVGGGMVLNLSLLPGEGSVGGSETRNALIRIDGEGKVFLTMPYPGMGLCIYSWIPLLIAEELAVALNQVHLEHSPPTEGDAANQTLDAQAIGHSKAVRSALKPLGEAAATARVMLIATAAGRWGADARSCHAREGEVIHTPTWRKLGYGALAIDAAYMPIPKQVELKAPRALPNTNVWAG
jgi:isoquinoline 1-oxidoreductase beta subunit